jgi:hypothetical protein
MDGCGIFTYQIEMGQDMYFRGKEYKNKKSKELKRTS